MKPLSEQIKAVIKAREIVGKVNYAGIATIEPAPTTEELKQIYEALNDAGSTLAALNLNPDREKRIKELEVVLRVARQTLAVAIEANTPNGFDIKEHVTIKKIDDILTANLKFDAAISGFASPDELTK